MNVRGRRLPTVESLGGANHAPALAYLAQRPYDNVYVAWLVETGRTNDRGVSAWVARRADGAIAGVAVVGAQVIPCADDDDATDLLATRIRRSQPARMLVGPRSTVARVRDVASDRLPAEALVRTSQPVYALTRATLRGSRTDADVRVATANDLDELAVNSAAMIGGEVGVAPDPSGFAFRARTKRILDAGWWWRCVDDTGDLVFQCNVGSLTAATAQIQGVWSPPAQRGAGRARRALGAICDRLLDVHPSLTLYVNDFNLAAVALYEAVGFRRVGEFQTVLY